MNGYEISKTHNLALLVQQCIDIDRSFDKLKSLGAAILTSYAVGLRYPDDFYMPTQSESQKAITIAEDVRNFILTKIKQ